MATEFVSLLTITLCPLFVARRTNLNTLFGTSPSSTADLEDSTSPVLSPRMSSGSGKVAHMPLSSGVHLKLHASSPRAPQSKSDSRDQCNDSLALNRACDIPQSSRNGYGSNEEIGDLRGNGASPSEVHREELPRHENNGIVFVDPKILRPLEPILIDGRQGLMHFDFKVFEEDVGCVDFLLCVVRRHCFKYTVDSICDNSKLQWAVGHVILQKLCKLCGRASLSQLYMFTVNLLTLFATMKCQLQHT